MSIRFSTLVLIAMCLVLASACSEKSPARPNIVLIMADDLGYGDLAVTGGSIEAPNLERLAAEGILFTDFHTSGVVCSPTRAGLLTGRYQQRAGIPGVIVADPSGATHRHGLQASETTLAELLQEAGYETAIVGKWHLGYDPLYSPLNNGFDSYVGFVAGNIDYFSHVDQAGSLDWWQNRSLADEQGYATTLINEHAVRFVEQTRDAPFFLYVAHGAPHYPYQGPDDAGEREAGGQFEVLSADGDVAATYRDMILEMDRGIGEILQALERKDLADNTLIFFLSDNGSNSYGSNAPYRGLKGTAWEGGHRVPFIARWPSKIPAGRVQAQLTSSLDIMPTIMDVADIPASNVPPLDGKSVADFLFGGHSDEQRQLFWNGLGMRNGQWKIVISDDETQLFNLESDPGETKNLSATHPDIAEEMQAALAEWEQDVNTNATPQPPNPRYQVFEESGSP